MSSKGWVVSLGAGREQVPLIKAIQAEGYACLAFDKNAEVVRSCGADDGFAISNRDVEHILPYISGCPVCGVMAAASEVPDVMAILAHRLGLPGVPVAAGVLLKDKLLYKKVLMAAGVPHTETVDGHVPDAGYPLVVKPRVSSGSRGVRLAMSVFERFQATGDLLEAHESPMTERYQPGPQISSETLIWDGMAVTIAFVDRFYESFAKEVGISSPSHWDSERNDSNIIISAAAKALGIRNGTIKCDLVLTEDGPKIIEMTCRLSGCPMADTIKQSTGIDYMRQAVRIACGIEPDWAAIYMMDSHPVALDMAGNRMDWDWSRKYIVKELGKCE